MTGDETARIIYLVLLGCVIGVYAIAANRAPMGQMARQLILWGLIFVGLMAGYGLWEDIRRDVAPSQAVFAEDARVEVPRSADGHYYLRLMLDGAEVNFIVDTGATDIVLSKEDAARVGIDVDALVYTGVAQTANGTVRSARARIGTVQLGSIEDRNVTAWVNEGEMFGSLLGMDYLRRFERIEIADDTLVLQR